MHGIELWRSDGTEAGTVLVKDVHPGESGAIASELVKAGGTLFFFADDGAHGFSLWASDGTAAGTRLVAGVNRFSRILAAAGSKVLLVDGDADHGFEPWISDGTAAGTGMIRDLLPGTDSSIDTLYPANFPIAALGLSDGTFLFAANDGVHGYELWHTDGTDAGTSLVADINSGSSYSNPHNFAAFGGKVYFNATTAADGPELWVTDGTAPGTARVKDPSDGVVFNPNLLTVANGLLFFRAGNGNLWRSDGTGPGTVQVTSSVSPDAIGTLGGSLVLIAGNTEADPVELWKSDGTSGGTVLVRQLNPESAACLYQQSLTEAAGASYFYFCPYQNQELWKTDGTAAGTVAVQSPTRTPSFPVLSWRGHDTFLTPAPGGRLLFDADNGNGAWLWRTDGTAAGTQQVVGVPFTAVGRWPSFELPRDSNPVLLGGSWLYGADGLWKIDPIGGGVTDLVFTGVQSFGFQPLGGLVLFQRYDAQEITYQLWKTDGTSPGTALVWDSTFSSLGTLGSQLLLLSLGGDAVWKTDGTPAGTVQVQGGLTQARGGMAAGNALYFTSVEDASHCFLWKTDGTAAGTSTVATLPGCPYISSLPSSPSFASGSLLFFQLDDGVHGLELWVTDGTGAGTHLVKDIGPGSQGAAIGPYFAAVQGRALFLADDGVHGQELWSTDGTDAGTSMVKDIRPGAEPSTIGWGMVPVGNRVYFTADDGVHGQELWITDGTAAGTRLVKDVLPGPETSSPSQLTPMGSRLVFTANDGAHGAEPWSTNGTDVGTFLYQDVAPGARSSGARSYTASPPLVYFIADDGTTGTELWSTPKALLESSFTDVPSDYWAWRFIESLFASGVTSGCGGRQYCPGAFVNRAQMAIFILAARDGVAPPPATGTRFNDVPAGYWAGPWIEELAREGVVGGCSVSPPLYCPDNLLTRAEMAVLLTGARHENPPPATGTRFGDVPANYWAARFIEQLATDGVTNGCGGGNYCPDQPITRGEMAVFLATAFHLPLPPLP